MLSFLQNLNTGVRLQQELVTQSKYEVTVHAPISLWPKALSYIHNTTSKYINQKICLKQDLKQVALLLLEKCVIYSLQCQHSVYLHFWVHDYF